MIGFERENAPRTSELAAFARILSFKIDQWSILKERMSRYNFQALIPSFKIDQWSILKEEMKEQAANYTIVAGLCFQNQLIVTFPIVNRKMFAFVRRFLSFTIWKSTNDDFANSKSRDVRVSAAFSFISYLKIDQWSFVQ